MRPTPADYHDLDVQTDRNVKIVDGTLIIKNIQKSHEGYYLCKATNGIGRGLSAVIYISVQGEHVGRHRKLIWSDIRPAVYPPR